MIDKRDVKIDVYSNISVSEIRLTHMPTMTSVSGSGRSPRIKKELLDKLSKKVSAK